MRYGVKNAKLNSSPPKSLSPPPHPHPHPTTAKDSRLKKKSSNDSPSKKKMKTPSFGQVEMENVIIDEHKGKDIVCGNEFANRKSAREQKVMM